MNKKARAVVTGIGLIAPGGDGREDFFQSLMNASSGLRPQSMLDRIEAARIVAGNVTLPANGNESDRWQERLLKLAFAAIDEAMQDSGLTRDELAELDDRCGLSASTSVVGYERAMKFVDGSSTLACLIDIPTFLSDLTQYTGAGGPVYSTVTACAAGTGGAGIALDVIRSGSAEVMVVVGTDALLDFSVAGFHSLRSMSADGCKPFDENRDGMSLGEGAAAFIVENYDRAKARGAYMYGEWLGYGIGNDAYHITSPDPEGSGAYRSMKMALDDAGLKPEQIDYINAHGTATERNDLMEISAIGKLFDSDDRKRVMISSTKSITGHCLGAAGSVELAATLLAVDRGVAPATVSLDQVAEPFREFNILQSAVQHDIRYAISNSFAFHGHSACIIVGKI